MVGKFTQLLLFFRSLHLASRSLYVQFILREHESSFLRKMKPAVQSYQRLGGFTSTQQRQTLKRTPAHNPSHQSTNRGAELTKYCNQPLCRCYGVKRLKARHSELSHKYSFQYSVSYQRKSANLGSQERKLPLDAWLRRRRDLGNRVSDRIAKAVP